MHHNFKVKYVADKIAQYKGTPRSHEYIFTKQALLIYIFKSTGKKTEAGRMLGLTHATVIHAMKRYQDEIAGYGSLITIEFEKLIKHAEMHPDYRIDLIGDVEDFDVYVAEIVSMVSMQNQFALN